MALNKTIFQVLIFVIFLKFSRAALPDDSITFKIILGNGTGVVSSFETNGIKNKGCDPSQKWAIAVHGYFENSDVFWVQELAGNLTKHRGGCVMIMDYRQYSKYNYFSLINIFSDIGDILVKKLNQFKSEGFDFNLGFLVGASFGARIVTYAGQKTNGQIAMIDAIEPAGPLFDYANRIVNASSAAKNVQCIHTSGDLGTRIYDCHQNWLMGYCGTSQPAYQAISYYGNHELSIRFYNSAFENPFYAEDDFSNCNWITNKAKDWPENFRMGYMEDRKSEVRGVLFARTTKNYPYNYVKGYVFPVCNSTLQKLDIAAVWKRIREMQDAFLKQ